MAVRPRPRRRFSPLTRRILFLNTVPLLLLAVGVLYLDDFRRGLIAAEIQALTTQSRIIAAALGEAAVSVADPDDDEPDDRLAPDSSRQILRRLVEPARVRARLFDYNGALMADTRVLGSGSFAVEVELLPPPGPAPDFALRAVDAIADFLSGGLAPTEFDVPLYRERPESSARDYEEAQAALGGETASALRRGSDGALSISVAAPVQRFRQVLGAVMLTADGRNVEASLRAVRRDILRLTAAMLAITVLLSLYLAGTIARPVRRLARAAERVRVGGGRSIGATLGAGTGLASAIPDLSRRGDEIGDLSASLRAMTEALAKRLDAIDRFAADVAHELKNPLTSLRSAVETLPLAKTETSRGRLLEVIQHDVRRLDRLITDISDASRLDAELQRQESSQVDLSKLLGTLVTIANEVRKEGQVPVRLQFEGGKPSDFVVPGHDGRISQVVTNLIDNARSFSPADGEVRVTARQLKGMIEILVEDDGPGIREDALERIFERFYTDRPHQDYGQNSGLGLSISKQIVEAHGGTIRAENRPGRTDEDGQPAPAGARFVVRLPSV